MNKSELIHVVAEATGIRKRDCANALNAAFGEIAKQLQKGTKVTLTGLGSFRVVNHEERRGVVPGTSESIMIPAKKAVRFKLATGMKL